MAGPALGHAVAVVTGASRGAGRGIAVALGATGATVYVTGRSTREGTRTENLPGTIEETADAVRERGGRGIALRCDHAVDAEVEAAFDRVAAEAGRIDLLVNNVWGGYEGHEEGVDAVPFWLEDVVGRWRGMFELGLRAHLIASKCAVPRMLGGGGLIVNTIAYAEGGYGGNLMYDVAKRAITAATERMALELRPWNIAAIALAPGFLRTERVLAAHAARPFDLSGTESPEYVGRAVAALAADPGVMRLSGTRQTAGGLAREYGFTDVDGTQPPPFAMPDGWEEQVLARQRRRAEAARG